jgi:endosialidase-like protein
MADPLKSNERPNLLELVEAHGAGAGRLGDMAICGDEANDLDQLPALIDLSLSGDETGDFSDVRLKTDIEQVGTTVYGLPLYHFRYATGPERFEGVMAQDVLQVMPDAVRVGDDGHYRVKYAELGIRMTRV